MEKHMGHSLPTWSCFCIYSYNLCLLAESAVSNIHNNYLFEETGEPCLRGLPGAWRQGLKRLMTCPSHSCSASTLAVQSVHCSKPSFSNTSLKSHAKAVVFILQFCFFLFFGYTYMILASGAARHLPAHLPDTRQLSRATPACSSA